MQLSLNVVTWLHITYSSNNTVKAQSAFHMITRLALPLQLALSEKCMPCMWLSALSLACPETVAVVHLEMHHILQSQQTPHHTVLILAQSPLLADVPQPRASDSAPPHWCEYPTASFAWSNFCPGPPPCSAITLTAMFQLNIVHTGLCSYAESRNKHLSAQQLTGSHCTVRLGHSKACVITRSAHVSARQNLVGQ